MKFLIAELYASQPVVTFGNRQRPVGTLVFDPEGEYFWPDENRRPGLCDVPHLRQQLALFTNRNAPNPHYGSWKVGDVRLDLRECPPAEVVKLCISEERQEHQNVIKIRTISSQNWPALIDLLQQREYNATDADVRTATGISNLSDVEWNAMRSNLIPIIRTVHDPNSALLRTVPRLLREGRIVVIDISLVSGRVGLQVAGMLLSRIFHNNQESFTDPERGGLIPVIAFLEEAQSVLGKSAKDGSPFVEWVKEGRKYSLGAILVTQQPGSIAPELLSQGDNFFAFHLLSAHDLKTLQFHNAHFSDDVLAHLLNEPIRGNAYFWSAPHQPFVLPARIRSFEQMYGGEAADETRVGQTVDTGLAESMGEEEKMIARLAERAREMLLTGDVQLCESDADSSSLYVYKPRLAAKVGEIMSEEERQQHCGGDDKTFVCDGVLNRIVASSGLTDGSPRRVRCRRESDGKEGEFYPLARRALGEHVRTTGKVTILS